MLLYFVLGILLLYAFLAVCLKRINKANKISVTTTVTKEIPASEVPDDIRALVEGWKLKTPSDLE